MNRNCHRDRKSVHFGIELVGRVVIIKIDIVGIVNRVDQS